MRGVFAVDEPSGQRWDLALDLLERGEPVSLGPITLRRRASGEIEATVASSWRLENVNLESGRAELLAAQAMIRQLLVEDERFRAALGGSQVDYVLVDDYEIGSVAIARLADNILEWLIELPG